MFTHTTDANYATHATFTYVHVSAVSFASIHDSTAAASLTCDQRNAVTCVAFVASIAYVNKPLVSMTFDILSLIPMSVSLTQYINECYNYIYMDNNV